MNEIVHPVAVEELRPWLRTLRTALLHDPDGADTEIRVHNRTRTWNPERVWGVRDRGHWVGTLATEARTVAVPGPHGEVRDVTADALTGVSVAATHRRRGLLRAMLTDSLATAKERGDAVSILVAAEWPIYGRYGYAASTVSATYRYRPRRRLAAPRSGDPHRVRPVDPAELVTVAADVFASARRAGCVDRDGTWWPTRLGQDGFRAPEQSANWYVHEGDGGVDGIVSWQVTSGFLIDGTFGAIEVGELVTAGDAAYVDLWAYLAGIDAVEEIVLDSRPVDEPIRWLLGDGRALTKTREYDKLWVRLLDVPIALSRRAYSRDGGLVLEIADEDTGGYAAGRFRLEAEDGTARCVPTSASADLRITQRALASAYLGGHRLRLLALTGGVEEVTVGSLALADGMFATALAPWNPTGF